MLEMVAKQVCEKLPSGCFDVSIGEAIQKDYISFKADAETKMTKLCGDQQLDVKQMEDIFWSQITKEAEYSMNNNFSLFGDVSIWNLDRFTKDESNIHTKPSHHALKVSESNFHVQK